MHRSASLVLLGWGLLTFQVAFSHGVVSPLVPLPIGIWPVMGGVVALVVGMTVGLLVDDTLYWIAVRLAWVGSVCLAFGVLFMTMSAAGPRAGISINGVAVLLGAALWLAALLLGGAAVIRDLKPGVAEPR